MARSQDEPFTFYGQIARSIDLDANRERVTFHLDPGAHFSDGAPLTSADVLFSFDLLKTKAVRSNASPSISSNRSTPRTR